LPQHEPPPPPPSPPQDGSEIGWEEFYDYTFPDDEKKAMGFKILENAMKWKQAAAAALLGETAALDLPAHLLRSFHSLHPPSISLPSRFASILITALISSFTDFLLFVSSQFLLDLI
jgi:hypothetical protein